MAKRLAMTIDGKLTYCSASDANIGKGRCNHIGHALKNEKQEEFLERVNKMSDILNKSEGYPRNSSDIKFLEEQFKNFNPDLYVKSPNIHARQIAADYGYGLEELVKDKHNSIKIAVISHGYFPEEYLEDASEDIKFAVASKGMHLDKLINDNSPDVSHAAAKMLEELKNKKNKEG